MDIVVYLEGSGHPTEGGVKGWVPFYLTFILNVTVREG